MTDALSTRVRNALVNDGIECSPSSVARLTERQLLRVRGLGRAGIAELKAWVARHSLVLQQDEDESKILQIEAAVRLLEARGYKVTTPHD